MTSTWKMSIWQLRNKAGKGRIGLGCTSIIGIGVQRGIRMEWLVTGEGSLVLGWLVAWLLGWLLCGLRNAARHNSGCIIRSLLETGMMRF